MFKPKVCTKCGCNEFCITEIISYNAHIDAKTKKIITDSVIMSNIYDVSCSNCNEKQDRAEFELSTLTD